MKEQIKNQEGFMLIEVLIAVAIFAIGILAVWNMQISALKSNAWSNDLSEATTVAEEKMEELIGMDKSEASLDGTVSLHAGKNRGFNERFAVNWTVDDDMPLPNKKTIHVAVTWMDRSGVTRNINLNNVQ